MTLMQQSDNSNLGIHTNTIPWGESYLVTRSVTIVSAKLNAWQFMCNSCNTCHALTCVKCIFRPLVGYGGGSSDDDDENDLSQNKSREGSLPHDRNSSEREAMTEERRAKLREIEVSVPFSHTRQNPFFRILLYLLSTQEMIH